MNAITAIQKSVTSLADEQCRHDLVGQTLSRINRAWLLIGVSSDTLADLAAVVEIKSETAIELLDRLSVMLDVAREAVQSAGDGIEAQYGELASRNPTEG